jgi:hypothetical protein
MYLREIECKIVEWVYLAQYKDKFSAVLSTVMNLHVP